MDTIENLREDLIKKQNEFDFLEKHMNKRKIHYFGVSFLMQLFIKNIF